MAESKPPMPTPTNLWPPFWRSGFMDRESLLFIEPSSGEPATAALLLAPRGPVVLESATGEVQYLDTRDYLVDDTIGRLTRTPGSRMPATTVAELRPSIDPDGSGFMHVRGEPSTFLLADEEGFFHQRQVMASYAFDPAQWTGCTPQFAGVNLPRTTERLRGGRPLVIGIVGDSISEGYNASSIIGAAPYQPPYGVLLGAGLQDVYGSEVAVRNFATAGWTSDDGLSVIGAVAAEQPDLVLVAFGMNDAGYADAPTYAANIHAIIAAITREASRAEFVLVSSMLPNPEWHYPQMERFVAYRAALASLCGRGIVLADLTSLWSDLLLRKTPYDLTGNGINHPNDFGHRLYAQTILSLLVE